MDLSSEQQAAIKAISSWFTSGKTLEFKLGGYAGTGKTTIIKECRLTRLQSVPLQARLCQCFARKAYRKPRQSTV